MSCPRTQRSDAGEAQPLDLESSSLPLSHSVFDASLIIYEYRHVAARDSDLVILNIAVNDLTHMRQLTKLRRTYTCVDRHLQTWTVKIRLFALRKMNNLGPHADECSVARSLIYVLSLNLYSYYVHASNVGSIKSSHMHTCPSIARRCGRYILL